MDYKFDDDSEEKETNSLNAVFILKDEKYCLTWGRIYLKSKKPVRLLEILRNPNLAIAYKTNLGNNNNSFLAHKRLYGSNQIIIKNSIFGERYIDISTIVIACEEQTNNITDAEINKIDNHSFYKKEEVSLSTKDNHTSEFSIRGESFSIKPQLNDDLNYNQVIFAYLTNPTLTASDNLIDNCLINISQSWDMLVNLKYFKLG